MSTNIVMKEQQRKDIFELGIGREKIIKNFWLMVIQNQKNNPGKPINYKKILQSLNLTTDEVSNFWKKIKIDIEKNPTHIVSFSKALESENIKNDEAEKILNAIIKPNFKDILQINFLKFTIDPDDGPFGKQITDTKNNFQPSET